MFVEKLEHIKWKREHNDRERDTENESEEERKRTRDFVLFL